jgi:PAS domain S-box-containing protein
VVHVRPRTRGAAPTAPQSGLGAMQLPNDAATRTDDSRAAGDRLARIIFDSISDGAFTVDRDCMITTFNRAAEAITGFSAREAIGRHCFEIFRTEVCHKRCALRDTLRSHDPIENVRVTILTREGCEIPISVSTTLLKDDSGEILGAVEFFHDLSEMEHLRSRWDQDRILNTIVSASPVMARLIDMLPNIAESECNVLIQGPSGSGKELIAQAVHSLSPRRYGPYIKLNCGALPATLLESELFGYSRGAFTDAKRDKPGQFCLADGGTLLLDEIGEMDTALQVKLLRVLNNGEYQPLGSTRPRRTDARIIAATNADLPEAIAAGRFREDLFFRINVVTLEIPPLRDRPEDIPILAEHFVSKLSMKSPKNISGITAEAMRRMRAYEFPGNVRELENAIEHAFVMCRGDEIGPDDLPATIAQSAATGPMQRRKLPVQGERERILSALRRHMGNRTRAADDLDMHRSTLWRKMKTLGLA